MNSSLLRFTIRRSVVALLSSAVPFTAAVGWASTARAAPCAISVSEAVVALPAPTVASDPFVAHSSSGVDLVVWQDNTGLRAARIRTSDRTLLDPAGITLAPADGLIQFEVAASGDGFLVAWIVRPTVGSSPGEVRFTRVGGADGAVLDAAGGVRISPPGDVFSGLGAAYSSGHYIVLWNRVGGVMAEGRIRHRDGAVLDPGGVTFGTGTLDTHPAAGTKTEVGVLVGTTLPSGLRDLALFRLDPGTGNVVAQSPLRPTLDPGATFIQVDTNAGITSNASTYLVGWVAAVSQNGFGHDIGLVQRIEANTGNLVWQENGFEGLTANDGARDVVLNFGGTSQQTSQFVNFVDSTTGERIFGTPSSFSIHVDAFSLVGVGHATSLAVGRATDTFGGSTPGTLTAAYLTSSCTAAGTAHVTSTDGD